MLPTDRDPTTDKATTATLEHPETTNTKTAALTCPECGNEKVARARRQGFDRVISLINIYPYSCRIHTCQARFYRLGRGGN
jgi:predicted RNA-binding Zn-ribbon protein involved in translation (DUF1610 family)